MGKLINRESSSLFSPLLDLVMNALGAFILMFVIYAYIYRPERLSFLAIPNPIKAVSGSDFIFTVPVTGGAGHRYFSISNSPPVGLSFDTNTGTLFGVISN